MAEPITAPTAEKEKQPAITQTAVPPSGQKQGPKNMEPNYGDWDELRKFQNPTFGPGLGSMFTVPGKGIDISRANLLLGAAGEIAFTSLDRDKNGIVTRQEVIAAGATLRELNPQAELKAALNSDTIAVLAAMIPAKGVNKAQFEQNMHALQGEIIKADTNKDGYLSNDEANAIKVPITKELEGEYKDIVRSLKKFANDPKSKLDVQTNEEIHKLPYDINLLDKNKDHKVSLGEVAEVLKLNSKLEDGKHDPQKPAPLKEATPRAETKFVSL